MHVLLQQMYLTNSIKQYEQGTDKNKLIDRGYSLPGAETASSDLISINDKLKSCLDEWLASGNEQDYAVEEFSIKGIMQKYNMKYPAALLSINWILNDPKTAIPIIKKGIR